MLAAQPVYGDTRLGTSPEPATEIIDVPRQATRPGHHPGWCDRRHCVLGESGARHSSTTTRLATGEQIFALTLVQHESHDPELLIEVTDTAAPDGLHVLTLPEVKALAETLLIEYLKAASLIPAARNPADSTVAAPQSHQMP
jgi:hypothetical protein